MAKPVGIRVALITSSAVIIAAVIGLFQLGQFRSQPTITVPGTANSPITMLSTAHDVTINYNVPDTATREAIEFLQNKAADTDTSIELTRQEVLLLSRAFQDFDQRTSGLQKLPDGRTLFGHLISGNPTIVIEEHTAAQISLAAGDYKAALKHSQGAIKAYEETQQVSAGMRTGDLTPENVGKLYRLAAITAQKLQKNELANEYAAKAAEVQPSPEHQALLATTLFNISKVTEAIVVINKAVEAEPSNEEYRRLKDKIFK